jgi:hypothetical protein
MKSLKLLTVLFALSVIGFMTMSFTFSDVTATFDAGLASGPLLPDLKVSAIATPGGLCKGNESKIRVSITNSQMAGVKVDIPVILFVSQNGYSHSYVGKLKGGIGPNANSGQPVWFNNVVIDNTTPVTLKAVVNPDHEILESVANNNTKIVKVKVKGDCNQPTQQQAANMIVTVYKSGTWSGGQGQSISGATVTVKRNGQSYPSSYLGSGKYQVNGVPKGSCKIIVTKSGYYQVGPNNVPYPNGQSYNMPTYEAKVNIAMMQN